MSEVKYYTKFEIKQDAIGTPSRFVSSNDYDESMRVASSEMFDVVDKNAKLEFENGQLKDQLDRVYTKVLMAQKRAGKGMGAQAFTNLNCIKCNKEFAEWVGVQFGLCSTCKLSVINYARDKAKP